MLRKAALSLVFLVLTASQAFCEPVSYECLEPTGKAYYGTSALVPGAEQGWQEDKISGGAFYINFNVNDHTFDVSDIIYRDSRGQTQSYAAQGYAPRLSYTNKNVMRIDVELPEGMTESYVLSDWATENPVLILTQVRAGTALPKASIFTARCKVH